MKISKLFHWLYALVMLLPIFAIGITCGYAMFNKNAYKSYADNEIQHSYRYDNTLNLVEGNKYYFQYDKDLVTNQLAVILYDEISIDWRNYQSTLPLHDYIGFCVYGNNEDVNFILYYYNSNNTLETFFSGILAKNVNQFNFIFRSTSNSTSLNGYYLYNYVMVNNKLDNVFYYAVDKVTESPLFNWAYNSFLATPFVYITNLFSIPSSSVIILLLSYWLAISIVWLTFDLIMYVPLLVHRWLDKGVLE